ncbi:hypothetical protein DFJ58DRAFT_723557 [Suillus subalutaceus]|uniref:uncharacterized protein n=1 Tax=Suillus subalutaceus TaxID=48586 RepID=UPI001B8676DD|nr:uncharacterized protein DFJ58DRAFT_723557 [Suillus subalutaceus]KAG1868304.1 hypothetical protein DFJ58DRAFT_723557 [Suillus subalutaceus]
MQTFTSNVDSPSVSATTGRPREPSDAIIGADLGLEIVRNNHASYRQRYLVEEKADIIQNISRRSFSSPISRLPTEILSEIFLYCLPEDEHLVHESKQAPVLLTKICRRWREVAVGLPRLWCRLQLEVGYDDWQQRAFCYDFWLKRSGRCPLSLKLKSSTDWGELRSLLQPHVQQISTLSLDFQSCDGPFMMEDFHALQELTIRQDVLYDLARGTSHTLSKLPVNLRRINMLDLCFNLKKLDFFTDSAWAHLTHIEISIDGLDAFTRILRLCPNLCSLKMFGVFYSIQTPEPITHTNLQSLRMSWSVLWSTDEQDIGLFNVITLPNLHVLEVSNAGWWPHGSFAKFLTRSKCPLERLIFGSGVWTTERQRAEYATLVPSFEFIADPEIDFDVDEE